MPVAPFYLRALAAVAIVLAGGAAPAQAADALRALARATLGPGQGVYVEAADGTVLVAQAAGRAVHPASVSKVPTTLALLRALGPEHRFTTTVEARGPIHEGTLDGDLLIVGGGDPYLVDENALLIAQRLNELGLQRVRGGLLASGTLMFDWKSADAAGALREVFTGQAPGAAWDEVRALLPGVAAPPAIRFDDALPAAAPDQPAGDAARPLLVHQSQTLLEMAKGLNDYSNNIFKPLADAAGGAAAVEGLARSLVPASMHAEIRLGDGAGTDPRNRLSPRAAVKLLRALEQELARSGHRLVDILPVAGIDAGTLRDRLDAPEQAGRVVGKTGTFGEYGASALIGAFQTGGHGTVYFAILNHGIPAAIARQRQDRFVGALLARLQGPPWPYRPDTRPAIARARLSVADGEPR